MYNTFTPASGKQYVSALSEVLKLLDYHKIVRSPMEGRQREIKRTYRLIKGVTVSCFFMVN